MKNLVFLALCWAMAVSQTFAQRHLPPSAGVHTNNWNHTLKNLLYQAGFELSAAKVQVVEKRYVEGRSSALVLDSTLSFYDYGLNGNDSLPIYKSRFSYPTDDAKLEVQGQYENGVWQFKNRITTVYDEQERQVDMFVQVYDPSIPTWVGDSRLEMYRHGDSSDLLDSVLISGWDIDAHDWVRLMTIMSFYDAQDRIEAQHTIVSAFGDDLLFKDIYSYDANGDNTLIESYYVEANTESLTDIIEMEYDNYRIVAEVETTFDGVDFIPEYRTTTEYNDMGLPAFIEHYEWAANNNDWVSTLSIRYEHDAQQRVAAKETAYHFEGVEDERHRFEYDYIEGELLRLETSYFWGLQENTFLVDGKTYYYYSGGVSDAPSRPQAVAALTLYPNPTEGMARVDLEGKVTLQVFDATGQLVASQTEDNGRTSLDMAALPAGIYMVRAFAGDKLYAGRLIKQ